MNPSHKTYVFTGLPSWRRHVTRVSPPHVVRMPVTHVSSSDDEADAKLLQSTMQTRSQTRVAATVHVEEDGKVQEPESEEEEDEVEEPQGPTRPPIYINLVSSEEEAEEDESAMEEVEVESKMPAAKAHDPDQVVLTPIQTYRWWKSLVYRVPPLEKPWLKCSGQNFRAKDVLLSACAQRQMGFVLVLANTQHRRMNLHFQCDPSKYSGDWRFTRAIQDGKGVCECHQTEFTCPVSEVERVLKTHPWAQKVVELIADNTVVDVNAFRDDSFYPRHLNVQSYAHKEARVWQDPQLRRLLAARLHFERYVLWAQQCYEAGAVDADMFFVDGIVAMIDAESVLRVKFSSVASAKKWHRNAQVSEAAPTPNRNYTRVVEEWNALHERARDLYAKNVTAQNRLVTDLLGTIHRMIGLGDEEVGEGQQYFMK